MSIHGRVATATITAMVVCAVIANMWLAWLTIRSNAEQMAPHIEQAATTTDPVMPDIQEIIVPLKTAYAAPKTTQTIEPAYTQPPVTINNVNIQAAPQEQEPQAQQAAAGAALQVFVEPRTMTTQEIATDIVHMYDPNGTAEIVGGDKVKATVFGGKSVTTDIIDGWEERLKGALRKMK